MSKSIRVSDELMALASHHAEVFHRSPPQQVEHWAQMGRVMESALSYPSLETVKITASQAAMDTALALPDTPEGRVLAHAVIGKGRQEPAPKRRATQA